MLTLFGSGSSFCDGVSRRSFLKAGFLGAAGLGLSDLLRLRAQASVAASHTGSGKAVIFVELAGGPTQIETYDPKPKAPSEYRGPLQALQTNVPGEMLSEWMVEQAQMMDKLAIVRSVHHGHNSHDPSSHLSRTGYFKTGAKGGANQAPCFGSVAAHLCGPNHSSMPAYVAVPRAMRNGRAAYLGQAHDPFETTGDPNRRNFRAWRLTAWKIDGSFWPRSMPAGAGRT